MLFPSNVLRINRNKYPRGNYGSIHRIIYTDSRYNSRNSILSHQQVTQRERMTITKIKLSSPKSRRQPEEGDVYRIGNMTYLITTFKAGNFLGRYALVNLTRFDICSTYDSFEALLDSNMLMEEGQYITTLEVEL